MNKTELIAKLAEDLNISKTKASEALNGVLNAIGSTLASGDCVNLVGFGNFIVTTVEEKTARNPLTGETITVPTHKRVSFKASKVLKDAVR